MKFASHRITLSLSGDLLPGALLFALLLNLLP